MIDVNTYAEFWRVVVDRIADGIRNEGGDPTDLFSPDLTEYLLRVGLTSWAERDTTLADAKRQTIIERYDVDGPNGMFPVRRAGY